MKYEICKGIRVDGRTIWTAIAWTDVISYGKNIVAALSLAEGSEFAILHNDEVVYQN